MQFSSFLILILAITVFFIAGCTQGTNPVLQATPPLPFTSSDLPALALSQPDLPSCYSVTEQSVKGPGNVGQLAKDLGWQAGYTVTYTCPGNGTRSTVFLQSLAVYPRENMAGIASMVDEQDRLTGYTYEGLVFPDSGPVMRGFYGKANETQASGQSPGTYLVTGGHEVPETNAVSENDMAEIIFYRGTIFEVLRMTGPETNATILRDMAEKASAKIS